MSHVSLFSEKSHDLIIGFAACCNGIQDLFVSDLVTLFHELFEFFQCRLIFVLGFGYDFLLLLDLFSSMEMLLLAMVRPPSRRYAAGRC